MRNLRPRSQSQRRGTPPAALALAAVILSSGAGAVALAQVPQYDTPVLSPVSSPFIDEGPSISADQTVLYFSSTRPGGFNSDWDIWMAARPTPSSPFAVPVWVPELSTTAFDAHPEITADGLSVYLDSTRAGSAGTDLYRATRTSLSSPWGTPVPVAELNTPFTDAGATVSADELIVVFFSDRAGGLELYEARRSSASLPFGGPTAITAVNSTDAESHPSLSADGLIVFFESTRPESPADTTLDGNLWTAARPSLAAPFAAPVLMTNVNTAGRDSQPDVSIDGSELFLVQYPTPTSPDGDIWVAASALSAPPVADAGSDVSFHPVALVCLDGTGSFDDNTASEDLIYSWTLVSKPAGSAAALDDPGSPMPCFVVDLLGSYQVQLVVTDEDGQPSPADTVQVATVNLPPVADAGMDQIVVIGTPAPIDGVASFDPENDGLTYAWTLQSAPAGSTAALSSASGSQTQLTPDLPGQYAVQLLVNDGFAESMPDTVVITAISAEQCAETYLMNAQAYAAAMAEDHFVNHGLRRKFNAMLTDALDALQSGDIPSAIAVTARLLIRTDGCILRGTPDPTGPERDWVTDCSDQAQLYDLLHSALSCLELIE